MKYVKAAFLWLFTIGVAVGPPIVFISLHKDPIWPGWPILFISFGLVLFFIWALWDLVRYSLEEKGNWGKFWRSVWSRLAESQSAFFVGACLASVGTGIHLIYSKGGPLHERYDTVIGIYLTTITATLGLKAFYDRLVPITDVNILLKRVTADLRQCKDGDLWIVYPALNIGYYRNHVKNKHRVGSSIVDDFSRALAECAERVKDVHAVTFDTQRIKALYTAYVSAQANSTGTPPDALQTVKDCVDSAEEICKAVVRQVAKGKGLINADEYLTDSRQLHHHPLSPQLFPQQTIVIGPVTYTLVSYGLPLYDPGTDAFTIIPGEHKLVDIVAYRREDTALAHLISEHLKQLIKPRSLSDPSGASTV